MSNRFHNLTIADLRPETDSAVCLTLDVPPEKAREFAFVQGQHLTLRARVNDEYIQRSYSICSGVDDGKLQVGIKRVENGVFSNFANDVLRPGDQIEVAPPAGRFYTELDPAQEKHYMCICAGSGITPILSIIKSVLSREPQSRVTLLFGNRNSGTIMFREELAFLKNRYMARFEWLNILSRERQDADVLFGRLDNRKGAELSRKRLIDIGQTDEFFLCGPESMISEVSRGLRDSGVPEERIHYELFFASAEDARMAIAKHRARATRYSGQVSAVEVRVAGRSLQFELTADGENILDGALSNGADLPFSCKSGVCATCKARLIEGQVEMDVNHSLSPEEVAQGMVLTCQAHPVSQSVLLDYDQT
ncbi:2Fe-2S iron-sulfur cluster-binding protein [Gilvimarinus sp. F26214L]|uniref:2Fe-2S iron-sulfur cluster-binding protein n=1 Tax=Gilvimarinus sp. DZF01 TaxID=3461371 RepID=UPI00404549DC